MLTGLIAIDLQKAFDTIDHKILLDKLAILRFSSNSIKWFQSYLSDRMFHVSLGETISEPSNIDCGVPQGSILGPLLFLIYINDMPQAISCNLFLYADDSCLVFQNKELNVINIELNKSFSKLCDWFVDNRLSIHFGEDKTKSILFASKNKRKNLGNLEINYNNINIKQHTSITYLGSILDGSMSGETMALKVIDKVNSRLRFLYRKNKYLTSDLRRLLCNALIRPHFDYVCAAL